LGGNQNFACEGSLHGPAVQSFFCGKAHEIRIIVFLRNVREDQIARARIETFGIGKEFADRMIGKMAGAGKNPLLDDPRIRSNLQHVQIVIGFQNQAIAFAQMDFDKFRHVAEIGANRYLGAVGAKREADGIGRVVRNRESVNFDIADGKALAGLDGLDAVESLAKCVRKNVVERVHGRFRDIERGFPEAEGLRKAVAMIGVFVSDQDAIEAVEIFFDGGKAGQSFALAQAGVHKDAGTFGFEQGDVARTAGREDGNAQTDGNSPRKMPQGE
jgi:hypothetical protein